MCSRIVQSSAAEELCIAENVLIDDDRVRKTRPRYNAEPRRFLLAIRRAVQSGHFKLSLLRWGLTPSWCTSPYGGQKPTHVPYLSLGERSFRLPYARRRCIVPMDAFVEWMPARGIRAPQPCAIAASGGAPLGIAAIWDRWEDPNQNLVASFAIVTVPSNETMSWFGEQMPLVLAKENYARWLGKERDPSDLLVPCPNEALRTWRISTRIGQPYADGAELLEPVEAA